ncbi:MAG: VWA domain-containing protein, partial [Anaerolineales bacterium]|nr:VWA domain-containing protein [Anaerolineales bacterium]
MHLRHSTRIRVLWLVMGGLLLLAAALGHVRAQETADSPPPLRVSGVDTGAFPRVDLYLAAADPLAPLPAAAGEVRVLDDGEAAEDASAAVVPIGVDLIFVIDANDTITTLDNDAELSRLEKARRSVMDFATTYMNAEGLDRVSVLVPGGVGGNGRFLLQDAATPSAVVEGLLAYAPEEFGETPLNAMLTQAVEHAARQRAANTRAGLTRYQAVLLFSDGARLDEQLAFDELTAAAQAVELPLFGAILGARADPDEIANVTQLTDPTGGAYLHMPDEAALAPFYVLWQQQGRQLRVSFTSAQRSSGAY